MVHPTMQSDGYNEFRSSRTTCIPRVCLRFLRPLGPLLGSSSFLSFSLPLASPLASLFARRSLRVVTVDVLLDLLQRRALARGASSVLLHVLANGYEPAVDQRGRSARTHLAVLGEVDAAGLLIVVEPEDGHGMQNVLAVDRLALVD